MTVKELYNYLGSYMKSGIGDGWQLNDVEADRKIYEERCNTPVMIVDDGMKPKFFDVSFGCQTVFSKETDQRGVYKPQYILALITDLTKEAK